ncbi:hypothetical protein CPLU01_15992 [Colletotrichum plurivorum]|uniref:Uncharacterized protein n=1 Tax=Colletotrichum plurivorum TaxID=2175906 RepID=A0A8H6MQF3_9PEZI|nr:hypothetical protein CPLU01_15992 [Colletotrichum plurivorum]
MALIILDVLQSRNPSIDTSAVIRGPNTNSLGWIDVNGWRPWTEFSFQNLSSIFQQPLSATWSNPPSIDEGSRWDHTVRNERSFDHFLQRFMFPIVNGALNRAASINWTPQVFYICDGGWCSGGGVPDWGFVTGGPGIVGKYSNLLPGDSNLSVKWQPQMEQSENDAERRQWRQPVSQVHTYAADSNCRYGYIITDKHFVALRFSVFESAGVASSSPRPSRVSQSEPSHQRVASGETDISMSSFMGSMSLDSTGTHSYMDNSLSNLEYRDPEYAVVPWENYGRRRLTVKMALFCLCLMAAGEIHIDYEYPPLDSWTKQQSGHGYIHNTSGAYSRRRPHGAVITDTEDQAPYYDDRGGIITDAEDQAPYYDDRGGIVTDAEDRAPYYGEFADDQFQSPNEEGLGAESWLGEQPLESSAEQGKDDDAAQQDRDDVASSVASGTQVGADPSPEPQRARQLKQKTVRLMHRNEGTGYKFQWKDENDKIKTWRSDWREETTADGIFLVMKKPFRHKYEIWGRKP